MSDLIHIDDIESDVDATKPEEGIVPQELRDDPDIGDGSTSHEGYHVASWRLHVLRKDSLVGMTEYGGNDRISRNARRAQKASREARTAEERAARRKKRLRTGVISVLAFVVVAATGATYAMELWGGKSVPSVQGFTEGNAVELLEEKGFEVELQAAPSDSLEGHVVGVNPAAGTRVPEGGTITLTIGEKRELPDVIGKTEDEAKAALEEAGATSVRVEPIILPDEEEGVVHEMRPAAGSVFISTEDVTLVVAHLPRVPDVTGLDEKAAKKTMDDAGITSHVTHERGTAEDRKKVIRTEPAANELIEPKQEVTIVLGDSLISPVRVEDYFDADLPAIRDFLAGEGFELKAATKGRDNHVTARFESAQDAQLSFLQKPWTHDAEGVKENADVLGGAKVEGVRLSVDVVRESVESDASDYDEYGYYDESGYVQTTSKGLELLGIEYASIDESTAAEIAAACGFGEAKGSCTQDSIKLPEGVERSGHTFYCSYGESGTHMWAVLLAGEGEYATEAKRIVVMCAPRVYFDTANMEQNSDAICDYVAYMDEYA
ncbi:MAG: PASTA domain-containing protein [Atopobiaceae bacterium]|nr:PASTA domain-containing protein [Atopobiaceae bacterium]